MSGGGGIWTYEPSLQDTALVASYIIYVPHSPPPVDSPLYMYAVYVGIWYIINKLHFEI